MIKKDIVIHSPSMDFPRRAEQKQNDLVVRPTCLTGYVKHGTFRSSSCVGRRLLDSATAQNMKYTNGSVKSMKRNFAYGFGN